MRHVAIYRYAASIVLGVLASGCVEMARTPERAQQAAHEIAPASDRKPHFVAVEPGDDLRSIIARSVQAAKDDAYTAVVYVGATWCEPCVAFHQAIERGDLDTSLASVRFLELDADVDGDRLRAAGYDGRLIPRFVVPTDDGAPSDVRIEGGIKGEGAVDHIVQRLAPMLGARAM